MTTKLCTGPRYNGESQSLSAIPNWHGCYGHLNVVRLDQNSHCTNYGKHDRIVTWSENGKVGGRIDSVWNLGLPTDSDVRRAARKDGWKIPRGSRIVRTTGENGGLFFEFVKG